MPHFRHAIGQGRASCGGAHHCFGSKTKAMAEMMCAWRTPHEADRCRRTGRIAVRSDVAAATGPCGHANVEIYWGHPPPLPYSTCRGPASKSVGQFEGKSAF